MNLYGYVKGNPLKYVDPIGNIAITAPVMIGISGVGIVAQYYWSQNQDKIQETASKVWNALSFVKGDSESDGDSDYSKKKRQKPPSFTPEGAGRKGAFKEAKRRNNIPTSREPDEVTPNKDRREKSQPGRNYKFRIPKKGGGTKEVEIRNDSGGHEYKGDPSQNRGPHFNDEKGRHYDY